MQLLFLWILGGQSWRFIKTLHVLCTKYYFVALSKYAILVFDANIVTTYSVQLQAIIAL